MSTIAVSIRTDREVKEKAEKAAKDLGLSLSSVVTGFLRQFIRTKKTPEVEEIPNAYFRRAVKQAEKNRKEGRVSPTFKTGEEIIAWLDDPNARLQNGDRA